jgi:tyrosinase
MGGGGSALDPIFWNHHCMVDYCWAKWNIELNHDTTNDASWVNQVNSHFVDADGAPATVTAGLTTVMPLLAYRYESSAIGSLPAKEIALHEYKKLEARLRKGAQVRFEVKQRVRLAETTRTSVARPLSIQTRLAPESFSRIIDADPTTERVFASIDYATLPASRDYVVRVFLNLPGANDQTPVSDPHYAGSFAFFGSDATAAGTGHSGQLSYLVSLSGSLMRLKSRQELNASTALTLQLVPVPVGERLERPDTPLILNHVDIITTPVIVTPPPE